MLNSGMGIFFAPNANIMPIDLAIPMKCGLITEHKTFIELVFFRFLLHINTIVCAFACQLQLWPEQPAVCGVSLRNVSLLPAILSLEVSWSPYLLFL